VGLTLNANLSGASLVETNIEKQISQVVEFTEFQHGTSN